MAHLQNWFESLKVRTFLRHSVVYVGLQWHICKIGLVCYAHIATILSWSER